MAKLLRTAPAGFAELAPSALELRGLRARAFQFPGGDRDRARAVVCLAGMGANGRSFVRQLPLAERWYLLLLDPPVETPPSRDPLEFAVDCVEEYVEHEEIERPLLVGASFGAAVAARVALRKRRPLRGLALVGAALSFRQMPFASAWFVDLLEAPPPLAQLVAPLAAKVMGGFALDREARDELVREARHFTGEELKRRLLRLLDLDLLPELPRLAVPTLLVHGRRDWLVPWRRARRAAQAIPGAAFVLIDGAGHLPYLSHPAAFNRALDGFLDRAR